MKIKFSKTVLYCSIFVATLSVVALTLAYMPNSGTAAGIDVDAESACDKGPKDEKVKKAGGNKYVAMAVFSDPIDNITDCYHESVNKMFNEKIKAMVKLGKTGKERDLDKLIDLISRPKAKDGKILPCSADPKDDNLSTYCLSQSLVIEFAKFRAGMNAVREQFKANAMQKSANIQSRSEAEKKEQPIIRSWDNMTMQKELFSYGENINRIDSEVKIAQDSIDQGLAAYHELQFALPLHMKYKKIIEGLEEYRDKMADIRHAVDLYPITFIDVTTASCN